MAGSQAVRQADMQEGRWADWYEKFYTASLELTEAGFLQNSTFLPFDLVLC